MERTEHTERMERTEHTEHTEPGLSLAYFSKRTLNLNGLEYCFRGLFGQNLTKSDFFRPTFVQNLTFMRKLPHFAKCDKTA